MWTNQTSTKKIYVKKMTKDVRGDATLSTVRKVAAKNRREKKNSERNTACGNRVFEGPHFAFNKSVKVIR